MSSSRIDTRCMSCFRFEVDSDCPILLCLKPRVPVLDDVTHAKRLFCSSTSIGLDSPKSLVLAITNGHRRVSSQRSVNRGYE